MAIKLFIDTNILLDLLEQRPYEINHSNDILINATKGFLNCYISEASVHTILYVSKNNLTEQIIRILQYFELTSLSESDLIAALKSNFKDKEDALLYFNALNRKCDYFITRNKKDFIKFADRHLPVMTPSEFMKHFKRIQ